MIEEDLNGCLIIFELVGLQYFSLKSMNEDNVANGSTKCRKFFLMVQLTIVGVVLITILVNFESPMTDEVNAKTVLLFLIVQLSNLGIVLMTLISLIKSYTSTRRIKKIFCNSKAISDIVKRDFYVSTDFGVIKRRAWWKFALMLMFFAVTTAGLIGDDISPEAMLAMLPIAFLLISVYQFIFYVGMLNCQLASLNALLRNYFDYKPIRIIDNIELYVTQLKPADESLIKLRAAMKVYNLFFEIGSD